MLLLAASYVAAGVIGFACGLDVPGGAPPLVVPVDTGTDVQPSLPETGPVPDGATDAGVDARSDCPTTTRGPAMIRVPDSGYCIDSTEVTNAQYNDFLRATDASVTSPALDGGLPDACAPLTTFNRKNGPLDGGNPALAVNRVTWCDALTYCKWAGKRLCGGVGADRDASAGEWMMACSRGGTQAYPYGSTWNDAGCWENDPGGSVRAVASKPACVGPPGVFDLSGNVREWIDSCDGVDQCANVGSTYASVHDGTSVIGTCREAYDYGRFGADPTIGFRCCASAE